VKNYHHLAQAQEIMILYWRLSLHHSQAVAKVVAAQALATQVA